MPQFNWSILAPVALAVAAAAAVTIFLISVATPYGGRRSQAVVPSSARRSSDSGGSTPASVTSSVLLPGRITGTPYLRSAPSSVAAPIAELQNGQPVEISGCSATCAWYLVMLAGQPTGGWVSGSFVTVQGDSRRLPALK